MRYNFLERDTVVYKKILHKEIQISLTLSVGIMLVWLMAFKSSWMKYIVQLDTISILRPAHSCIIWLDLLSLVVVIDFGIIMYACNPK